MIEFDVETVSEDGRERRVRRVYAERAEDAVGVANAVSRDYRVRRGCRVMALGIVRSWAADDAGQLEPDQAAASAALSSR